jgi:hypothetical protein
VECVNSAEMLGWALWYKINKQKKSISGGKHVLLMEILFDQCKINNYHVVYTDVQSSLLLFFPTQSVNYLNLELVFYFR